MAKGRLQLRLTPEALAELERRAGGKDKRQAYIEAWLTSDGGLTGSLPHDVLAIIMKRAAEQGISESAWLEQQVHMSNDAFKMMDGFSGMAEADFAEMDSQPASPNELTDARPDDLDDSTSFNDPVREKRKQARKERKAALAQSVASAIKAKPDQVPAHTFHSGAKPVAGCSECAAMVGK